MECSLFTEVERRSTELQQRYSENDTAFCDNWLFDTVNHIRILRLKFEKARGRPYESQRINNDDWVKVEDETQQVPIETRTRLLLNNWPGVLLEELRDLEQVVLHL